MIFNVIRKLPPKIRTHAVLVQAVVCVGDVVVLKLGISFKSKRQRKVPMDAWVYPLFVCSERILAALWMLPKWQKSREVVHE